MSNQQSALGIGRFSTRLLEQFGAQHTVARQGGGVINKFNFSRGEEVFLSPDAVNLSSASQFLVSGYASTNVASAVTGYFSSRGASKSNAQAMAAITMDVAKISGISPMQLLEYTSGKTSFLSTVMNYVNQFRPEGQQQDSFTHISNKNSLRQRTILA